MKQRVLVIINTIDAGGAETFVMKIFRCLSKEGYIFDFLINKKDSNFYLNEIRNLEGRIYYGFSKSHYPVKSFRFIRKTVKENGYKNVLCIAVHPLAALDLLAARLGGAKILLTRSTNSNSGGRVSSVLAVFSRPFVRNLSTVMLAPSREAGIWMFGKKAVQDGRTKIITNGVDLDLFRFNKCIREKKREELGIIGSKAIIHIGRFNRQKNHAFLIDVFQKIHEADPNTCLLLVGTGELEQNIRQKVFEYGLGKQVRFLGIRNDISQILSAADLLLFPSLYEGMPNVVIEAQSTGLPCIVSDSVSADVKLLDSTVLLPLNTDIKLWVEKCAEWLYYCGIRDSAAEIVRSKGYSIESTAQEIKKELEGN